MQYDKSLPEIEVHITKDGQEYTIPSGYSATIRWGKPDKHGCTATGTVSGSTVTFQVTEQMACVAGRSKVTVEIMESDSSQAGTAKFEVIVDSNPIGDNTIVSDSEIADIQKAIEAGQNADKALETATEKANIAVQSANIATEKANIASTSATTASQKAEEASQNVDAINDVYASTKKLYDEIVKVPYVYPFNTKGMSDLELDITARYERARNGKVFAVRFKKYENDTSALGEYYLDSVGLTCNPSTDTVEGQDDFLNQSPFQWEHCNYVRDDDSVARVTALKGRNGYKEEGAVDVGSIMPTFWWKQEIGETYNTIYLSDSPHAELGLVPWYEAVKADGSVLPYYIGSAFPSVNAIDGKLRSQPNLPPAYDQSHNGNCTEYQKKGAGYNGGGSETNLFALIMCAIKYRTMNVDYFSKGCTQFNTQVKCAVAETGVKRVLLSSKHNFYKGCCVSVGVARKSDNSTDRGEREMHSKANRVRVESIEEVTVSGTKYYALNLETDTAFDTDTNTYVSSMPCFAGETESVIGKHDGAYLSNTDGLHTMRICGREFLWGQGCIFGATALKLENNAWHVMKTPKGVKANSGLTGYVDSGVQYDYNDGKDTYQGDLNLNAQYGTYAMRTKGSASSLGVGDFIWEGGTRLTDGETREFYSGGNLGNGSYTGLACVACWAVLGAAGWICGSRD